MTVQENGSVAVKGGAFLPGSEWKITRQCPTEAIPASGEEQCAKQTWTVRDDDTTEGERPEGRSRSRFGVHHGGGASRRNLCADGNESASGLSQGEWFIHLHHRIQRHGSVGKHCGLRFPYDIVGIACRWEPQGHGHTALRRWARHASHGARHRRCGGRHVPRRGRIRPRGERPSRRILHRRRSCGRFSHSRYFSKITQQPVFTACRAGGCD